MQWKCSASSPSGNMSTCTITTIRLTSLTHSVKAIWVLSSFEIQRRFSNSAHLDCTEPGASDIGHQSHQSWLGSCRRWGNGKRQWRGGRCLQSGQLQAERDEGPQSNSRKGLRRNLACCSEWHSLCFVQPFLKVTQSYHYYTALQVRLLLVFSLSARAQTGKSLPMPSKPCSAPWPWKYLLSQQHTFARVPESVFLIECTILPASLLSPHKTLAWDRIQKLMTLL